ncbi:MAG: alpha/beta hydrolase [Acidobacteriota bacterium]|nr:alpha/beta hydrolase [Acidobacteriota bacterium]
MSKFHSANACIVVALMITALAEAQEHVSFPTQDGGIVYADVYGRGDRAVVLAHGARFDKGSWEKQGRELAQAGFRAVALDFRGYGKSRGGRISQSPHDELYLDVLAAVQYLHGTGAKTVSVVGASMGGGAAGRAAVQADPGQIDGLVLLAAMPIDKPERMTCRKLFITSQGDPIADKVRDQYRRSPEPKELLILDGSAHAQNIFATDQGERLMEAIERFLSSP